MSIHVFECPQCHEMLAAEGAQDEFSVECSGCHVAVLVSGGGKTKVCTCGAELVFAAGIRPGVSIPCPQCAAPVTAPGEVAAARVLPRLDAPAAEPKLRLRSGSIAGRPCPSCRTIVSEDVVLCTNCGLDFRTGKKIRVKGPSFSFPAIPWFRIAMLLILVALTVVGYARRKDLQPFAAKAEAGARAWFARFAAGEVEPAPATVPEAVPAVAPAAPSPATPTPPVEPGSMPAAADAPPCTACGGAGKSMVDCKACICPQCRGRRIIACATCRGQKATVCPACRGMKFGPDREENVECSACGGAGTVRRSASGLLRKDRHGNVVTQVLPCRSCNGSGRKTRVEKMTCSSCNGRGYAACAICSGAGTAACPQCSGAGLMPTCSACGGARRVEAPCAECGGSGKAKVPPPAAPG